MGFMCQQVHIQATLWLKSSYAELSAILVEANVK